MADEQASSNNEETGKRWRTYAALVLAVLFGISLVAANHAAWLVTTVLDTDTFVDTLAPIPKDPDVARALGQSVANSMLDSVEVGEKLADALPDGLAFLAVPVAQGLSDRVTEIATDIIQSDAFSAIWQKALGVAHRIATLFIKGANTEALATEDGVVTLDLTEAAAPILEQLDTLGFDVLEGTTPDLTIELFEVDGPGTIQTIVQIINSVRWFAIALTVVLVAAVFAIATDRRRAALWVGTATAAAMLFSLIDIRYLKSAVTSDITDPVASNGVSAAWDIVFSRFVLQSWIVLALGVVIALGGWLSGNSDRAIAVRSTFTGEGDPDAAPNRFAVFIATYKRSLEWAATGLVALVLLIAPPTSIGLVVFVIAALAVFVSVVEFIASKSDESADEHASEPAS